MFAKTYSGGSTGSAHATAEPQAMGPARTLSSHDPYEFSIMWSCLPCGDPLVPCTPTLFLLPLLYPFYPYCDLHPICSTFSSFVGHKGRRRHRQPKSARQFETRSHRERPRPICRAIPARLWRRPMGAGPPARRSAFGGRRPSPGVKMRRVNMPSLPRRCSSKRLYPNT